MINEPYPGAPESLADLVRPGAPTPERFFLVALGLEDWTDEERRVIGASAHLADYAKRLKPLLQNQRKLLQMERELEIGRQIQRGFLPDSLPDAEGWEARPYFQPAHEVSGDFYDAFRLPSNHLALVIADVCGKGVGAALYMTLFRSLLRAFALQAARLELFAQPGQLASHRSGAASQRRATLLADLTSLSTVELTNDYVARTHAKELMFASLFFGVLNAATGTLTYVNAGHDSPILISQTGLLTYLNPTGPLVGIDPHFTYDIDRVQIEPGETLFAYTDGVTEARNQSKQFFGVERLLSIIDKQGWTANFLINSVVKSLHEHIADAEPSDDVTMLALHRLT